MKIAVTGSNGYLGQRLLPKLAVSGFDTVGIIRPGAKNALPSIPCIACDLADSDALDIVMAKVRPDIVIHSAAYIPRKNDIDPEARSQKDNIRSIESLLRAASRHGVRGILNMSSIAVYGEKPGYLTSDYAECDPALADSIYGHHKLETERLVASWSETTGGHAASLRLAGMHGAGRGSGVVFNFIRAALANTPLRVPAPDTRVALLFVDDAADTIVHLIERLPADEIPKVLNLGGSEDIALKDLAELVHKACSSETSIELGSEAPVRRVMSTELAQQSIGFRPTPIMDWIQREIRLLKRSGEVS